MKYKKYLILFLAVLMFSFISIGLASAMTAEYNVNELNGELLDNQSPIGKLNINGVVYDSFSETIVTEIVTNRPLSVIITGSDEGSGLDETAYYLSEKALTLVEIKGITQWIPASSAQIDNDGEYIIYARLTDVLGNATYISSTGIVKDSKTPEITGINGDIANGLFCIDAVLAVNENVSFTLDSMTLLPDSDGHYIITAPGEHNITATDEAGNTTSMSIIVNGKHSEGEWYVTLEPSCTESGEEKNLCNLCGTEFDVRTVQNTGHTEGEWTVTTKPTCTELGEEENACATCGEVFKSRELPALGHFLEDWILTTEPTCTEEGEEKRPCTVCGEDIESRSVSVLGHTSGQWQTTIEPTCVDMGEEISVCNVCGITLETSLIPETGHLNVSSTVTLEPNCTEKGTRMFVCDDCGFKVNTVDIEPTGHDLKFGRCMICGYEDSTARAIVVAIPIVATLVIIAVAYVLIKKYW